MKSGLEGRNNKAIATMTASAKMVSMKSGLEGRNNESFNSRKNSFVMLSQ